MEEVHTVLDQTNQQQNTVPKTNKTESIIGIHKPAKRRDNGRSLTEAKLAVVEGRRQGLCGHSGRLVVNLREQHCSEVALSIAGSDSHNELVLVLRTLCKLESCNSGSSSGNAHQQTLFLGETASLRE